jgi:hypothetical protein
MTPETLATAPVLLLLAAPGWLASAVAARAVGRRVGR